MSHWRWHRGQPPADGRASADIPKEAVHTCSIKGQPFAHLLVHTGSPLHSEHKTTSVASAGLEDASARIKELERNSKEMNEDFLRRFKESIKAYSAEELVHLEQIFSRTVGKSAVRKK